MQTSSSNVEPIAVIGFGLKFPQQASTPEGFWDLLVQGQSARTVAPENRYNTDPFYRESVDGRQKMGTIKTKHGHYISESLDRFDAPFFSISPHEAECMDPQQRWLLEVAYHALENAGLTINGVTGSNTSVYVGSFMNDFETMVHKDIDTVPNTYHATGKASSILANRLSWFYNLKGPSVSVNTACSGSLVALHLACESLRSGETSMGLVCGANLIFTPENTAGLSNQNFLSPDGICYAFDERANGYSRGEGIACLVIKPLSAALRDNDPIRAVIRGTGVNSDGRTPGISQPNCDAQVSLIRGTYERFGLALDQTRYFEAHGTGTQVGDPIEAQAIATVFRSEKDTSQRPLYVGALKSNIGHLEGASGLAAVIKAILVLENGVIPPNIWHERRNPAIKDEWGLEFPTAPVDWPSSKDEPRRVSVNSFGFGGTNAHVVIDDAQSAVPVRVNGSIQNGHSHGASRSRLLVWSAVDENVAVRVCEAYRAHLATVFKGKEGYLDALAYTLSQRRSHFPWRSFSINNDNDDLADFEASAAVHVNPNLRLCFVFTGQGAQWAAMGKELLEIDAFRNSLEDSDMLLREMGCQFSVIDKLYNDPGTDIDHPEFSQPLCTVLQIALVDLLSHWRIHPYAVTGHSSGEVAAAYSAGIITKSYGLRIAFFRGVAVSAASQMNDDAAGARAGGMMAVRMPLEKCEAMISAMESLKSKAKSPCGLVIACHNSPQNLTVSGDMAQLDKLKSMLKEEGIIAKKLNVSIAYHNASHMEPAAGLYSALIGDQPAKKASPKCFMASSVRDKLFTPDSDASEVVAPDYWVDNLVRPVRFTQAVRELASILEADDGVGVANAHFLEVGPSSTLKSAIQESLAGYKDWNVQSSYSHMLARQTSAVTTAMSVAGRLHCLGYPVKLEAVNQQHHHPASQRVLPDLPSYPFNHSKQYWLESRISKDYRFRKFPRHDFLGSPASDWNELEPHWNNTILLQEQPWVRDHRVTGPCVYPAAGMLVMAIEAARQMEVVKSKSNIHLGQPTGYRFANVAFSRSIVVPESKLGAEVQFHLRKADQDQDRQVDNPCYDFRLYVRDYGEWVLCCRGSIAIEYEHPSDDAEHEQSITDHVARSSAALSQADHEEFYTHLQKSGLEYGPVFQINSNIRYGVGADDNEDAVGVAELDFQKWTDLILDEDQSPCLIHPAALDCIIQVAFLGITRGGQPNNSTPTMVPTGIHELWISGDIASLQDDTRVSASARSVQSNNTRSHAVDVDYIVVGADGRKPLILGDVTLTSIEGTTSPTVQDKKAKAESAISLYHVEWKPDVNLLGSRPDLFTVCSDLLPNQEEERKKRIKVTEYACFLAMSEVMRALDSDSGLERRLSGHLQKYAAWMRHETKVMSASANPDWTPVSFESEFKTKEQLWQTISSFGPEGTLIAALCPQLLSIVKGETDPLGILFGEQSETLSQYYLKENPPPEVIQGVQKYVDCLAHANPNLRVLEIGGGTGGMTGYVLDIIGGKEKKFSEYVFTDISPAFFKAAREKFGKGNKGMSWKVLDIERLPADQGFEAQRYDLIVASNVLHATKDLSTTLSHTRTLLKPGGKLILVEGISPNLSRTSFIFGCLPGWWLSTEPYRQWGPLVPSNKWDELLRQNSFSGVELVVDGKDPMSCLASGVITSARPLVQSNGYANGTSSPEFKVLIVRSEKSALQQSLTTSISEIYEEKGMAVRIIDAAEIQGDTFAKAPVIFLQTIDQFTFHDVDEKNYNSLKTVLGRARNLLWVIRRHDGPNSLEQEAVLGLARSVMSETEGLNIVTLGLEDVSMKTETMARAAKYIWSVQQQYLSSHSEKEALGEEIFEIDGSLCLSRVVPAKALANEISAMKQSGVDDNYVSSLGRNDSPVLGRDQVEIKISKLAVSPSSRGSGLSPSREIIGVINQVGQDQTSSGFHVGDAVVAILPSGTSTTASIVRCPAALVHRLPSSFNTQDTTSLPLPLDFVLAYDALQNCARLQRGESILVYAHGGSDSLGQATVQVAQHQGADVFVCFEDRKDEDDLWKRYGISKSHTLAALPSQQGGLAADIRRRTAGRGVDVVVTLANGKLSQCLWDCVTSYGRIIELADTPARGPRSPTRRTLSMKQNIMFARIDTTEQLQAPERLTLFLPKVMELIEQETLVPVQPIHALTPAEIKSGRVNKDTLSGKVVVSVDLNTDTSAALSLFDSGATYMIAGGLGGLGKSISRWMISHGARHLILLSRQGADTPGATEFMDECSAMDVSVFVPKCDISCDEAVSTVCREAQERMPPIKGCIQASMVLQSAMFANMTLSQWTSTLDPKVRGSSNLAHHLPQQLDFFILLSSVCGIIGASGQSNYAFGCAYQDALARSEASIRQRPVSIDLGIVEGAGYTAEHKGAGAFMRSLGMQPIPQDYLLSMLGYYCNPGRPAEPSKTQIVAGVMAQEELQRNGLVRTRFYSRPLWTHLQRRESPRTEKPTVNGTRRSATSRPAPTVPARNSSKPEVIVEITSSSSPNVSGHSPASLIRAICDRLSDILAISAEDIDPSKPVHLYGVDSLVAMEMRVWFREALQLDVAVFDILSNRPIEGLAREVLAS
nr:polyketide synthase [Aspergillus sp.]